MKIKPLSFNYPMVQSLKTGTKTVTRRLQKAEETPLQIGDVIWVREAHTSQYNEAYNEWLPIYQADCSQWEMQSIRFKEQFLMPKKYARFFLKITKVTEERLLDITNEDALREGLICDLSQSHPITGLPWCFNYLLRRCIWSSPKDAIISFYEKIYGSKILNENPKVWRYEFMFTNRPETEDFAPVRRNLIANNQFLTSKI
jgi:hypothetical protein